MDPGKLFIGGIAWDTNEDRLKEYFKRFGDVLEAVIMKDRATGRARGFGFVVFADPAVAERVVLEKHLIDGRNVEAKKAVPRDDQNIINKISSSNFGLQALALTKKIFVGGLASTVTENHFKRYFEQFGTITDVVVMYDHNTQRPRGFGFITYESEEAVEKVLHKMFHELNGKMVEVKRAVPKELSLGPNRNAFGGYSYSPSRLRGLLDGYAIVYGQGLSGGYGTRMDGRSSPANALRTEFFPIGPAYGTNLSLEAGLCLGYGGNVNISSNGVSGRGWNPLYSGNSSRVGSALGDGFGGVNKSISRSAYLNLWGEKNHSFHEKLDVFPGSIASKTGIGFLDNIETIWGSSADSSPGGVADSTYSCSTLGFGSGNASSGFRKSNESIIEPASSYFTSRGDYNGAFIDFLDNGAIVPNWQSSLRKVDRPIPLDLGFEETTSDFLTQTANGHVHEYSFANRQTDAGIAA